MELTIDLCVALTVRIAVLFTCGGYLFFKWAKAPRRYFFDLPFLMGVSFTALAVSKIFDWILMQAFNSFDQENQYTPDFPGMGFGQARWLFILVVLAPLLYANLRVWASEHGWLRLMVIGIYVVFFAVWILATPTFAGLALLLSAILLPVAAITIITFMFAYATKRLPNVHGLLVGLGWVAYLVTSVLRPVFLSMVGTGAFGLVSIAELLDMLAWLVIFAGLTLKPKYAKDIIMPMSKITASSP